MKNKKSVFNTLNVVTTAMLSAVAIVLASAFHNLVGDLATMFSPMHFPVFLIGILCGQWLGLIGGFLTPIVAFFANGRPPFPNGLVPMVFELATYGFLSGLLRKVFLANPKTNKVSSVLALAISMIAGRLVNAIVGAIIMAINGNPFFVAFGTKFIGNFTSTWVAIVIQLVLIPAILFALQKSGILLNYLPDIVTVGKPEATTVKEITEEEPQ